MTGMDWRPANRDDVAGIAALSNRLHVLLPERDEVFAEKIRLSPDGCHVLEAGEAIVGYVLSHPWRRADPPALDTPLGGLPADADCWYVHDLGIGEQARGAGAATAIVERLAEQAARQGFGVMALVAVGDAGGFWRRLGFRDAGGEAVRRKLAAYGAGAAYMERKLETR